jgi:PAS domain S-box-containing protein
VGYDSADELLAAGVDVRTFYVDAADREGMFAALAEEGRIDGRDVRFRRRDGSTVWVSITARPVIGVDGTVTGAEGSLIDVTDRRRAQASLEAVRIWLQASVSEPRWRDGLEELLETVGRAAEVGRAFLCSIDVHEDGTVDLGEIVQWSDDGVPRLDLTVFDTLLTDPGHPLVTEALRIRAGEGVTLHLDTLPSDFRSLLQSVDIGSAVASPVLVDGELVSVVGFTESATARPWWTAETEALGALAGAIGTAIARERAEDEYRTMLERLPAIAYSAPAGLEPRWLYVTPRIKDILGYTAEEWLSDPGLWAASLHPDDVARELAAEEYSFSTGEPFIIDYRMVARNGRTVWIHDEAEVVTPTHGGPPYLRGLMVDITDRKRAEEALTESRTRLQSIIDAEPECVKITTPDCLLVDMNPAGLRMVEAEGLDQVRGKDITDLILDPYREQVRAVVAAAAAGAPGVATFEIEGLKGTHRWLEMHAAPLHDTVASAVLSVTRDVTEHHLAEQELRENLELLRATDAERRRLLRRLAEAQDAERARIAEDLHDDSIQVMTAVGLRLERVRRQVSDEAVTKQIDDLVVTVSSAISRLRRLMFELSPRSLTEDGLAPTLRALLAQIGDEMEIRAAFQAPHWMEPDPATRGLLYRVTHEALANVRKHSGASTVAVTLARVDDGYRATIADDGQGFEVERATSLNGHLGLTAMRERVEAAGGRLRVESVLGEGTTVDCWVPERAPTPTSAS